MEKFWRSIKGKILLMGGIAIVAAILLGYVGMTALNKSSRNNGVLNSINKINLYQYENRSLDTSYLYFLDSSYLENIVKNLANMEKLAQTAGKEGAGNIRSEIASVSETVTSCKDNYNNILKLSTERGFTKDVGLYSEFLKDDAGIGDEFAKIKDDKSWVDGTWIELGGKVKRVNVKGKQYYKYTYTNIIPNVGKRENFLVRIGGDYIEYSGDLYINNISLKKEKEIKKLDISLLNKENLSGSYGDALKGIDVKTWNGNESIAINTKYTKANKAWEEVSVKIPVTDYDIQNYESISYDLYMSPGEFDKLKAACAFADKYDFNGTYDEIDEVFSLYSSHVTEGNDISKEAETIKNLFDEISVNLDAYVSDEDSKNNLLERVNNKFLVYEQMAVIDNEILSLKKENIELSQSLTKITDKVRNFIDDDTSKSKVKLSVIIFIVLAASALVIFADTYYISRSMNRSVKKFKETLSGMMEGDLTVRAEENTHDEFSIFGKYVNEFLVKISGVIKIVQDISETLKKSGDRLDSMAKSGSNVSDEIGKAVEDLSYGAVSQAEEVDMASSEISEMGGLFKDIVESVDSLADITDDMRSVSEKSSGFMVELNDTNIKTSNAFSQVVKQIYTTNESVKKIQDATELITDIASETNLLSLNASIEAARAGEAGRGFAVVASEISQLAAQSASSAERIRKVIEELVYDTEMTVSIVDEVSEIMSSQQVKLNKTKDHFRTLEHGIENSHSETGHIKKSAAVCEDARKKVEEVILSLSSISEENAASAQETTASMVGLNETISELVNASRELNGLADELDRNLRFFSI